MQSYLQAAKRIRHRNPELQKPNLSGEFW